MNDDTTRTPARTILLTSDLPPEAFASRFLAELGLDGA
jgi:hypothetical protein